MPARTAVQNGFVENGIPFGLAASTPTTFAATDTLAVGTQSLYLASVMSVGTMTMSAAGSLTLTPGAEVRFSNGTTFLHSPGVIPTSALGSPQTGPLSGGSVPGVFVSGGN